MPAKVMSAVCPMTSRKVRCSTSTSPPRTLAMASINHPRATGSTALAKTTSSKIEWLRTEIYVGGYLLSASQVGRLCVEAWGIPQARVESQGPLDCAFYYLNSLTGLDSPTIVPVKAHCQNDPKAKDIGFILTCSIGYTDIGAPKPDLSLTDEVQAYADRWFPPHIRKSPTFRKCVYVQSKHSHRFTRALISRSFSIPHCC